VRSKRTFEAGFVPGAVVLWHKLCDSDVLIFRAVDLKSRHASLVAQLPGGLQVPRRVLTQTLKAVAAWERNKTRDP